MELANADARLYFSHRNSPIFFARRILTHCRCFMKILFRFLLLSALLGTGTHSLAEEIDVRSTETSLPSNITNSSTPHPDNPNVPQGELVKGLIVAGILSSAVVVGAVALYFQNRRHSQNQNAFWIHHPMETHDLT